jgi:RimJ/RimL family protein N-acetyltransferase
VVRLRPFREADVPAVVAACGDPEIPRFTRVPSPYGETEARVFLASAEEQRRRGVGIALAIVPHDSDRLLGATGLRAVDWENSRAEIGYWVVAAERRRGVASRALRLLAEWALLRLGLARIEALAHVDNVASHAVAERGGFVREGVLRSYSEIKGSRWDQVMYSLVREDLR